MSTLWYCLSSNGLTAQPLSGSETVVAPLSPDSPPGEKPATGQAYIACATLGGQSIWLLHVPPTAERLRINGVHQELGLIVLADGDEIRFAGQPPIVFSTESRAVVAQMPKLDGEVNCQRCKSPIEPGAEAVCCPGCGLWFHMNEALPCWSYGDSCTICGQSTSLGGGFQRVPEGI